MVFLEMTTNRQKQDDQRARRNRAECVLTVTVYIRGPFSIPTKDYERQSSGRF